MKQKTSLETVKLYLGLTLQSAFLGFGLYFLGRIIRTNLYYPLLSGVNASNPSVGQILTYCGHIIFLALFFMYLWLVKEERPCLRYGRLTPKSGWQIPLGLLCGFLMNGAAILAAYLHGDIDMVPQTASVGLMIVSFFAVALQSSTEEIQYRLWYCGRMEGKAPLIYTVAGSAITFGLVHCLNNGISLVAVVNIALIGAIYALSVYCFDSVWFACAHHTAWNFTQNFVFGLPNSGNPAVLTAMAPTFTKDSFFYDSVFGVEGTGFTVLMNVAVCGLMIVLAYRKYQKSKSAA